MNNINLENELYTKGKGLVSKLKSKFIPDTRGMCEYALQKYSQSDDYRPEEIDHSISILLRNEYEIYQEKLEEFKRRFLSLADTYISRSEFPEVYNIIKNYKDNFNIIKDLPDYSVILEGSDQSTDVRLEILDELSVLGQYVNQSISQGSKTRAGSSLMNIIAKLLSLNNFSEGTHFKREYEIGNVKLDFLLPNESIFYSHPQHCVGIACQTTSNDRYRMSLPQLRDMRHKYACYGFGAGTHGALDRSETLSQSKLDDYDNHNIKVVVLNSVIDERLENSDVVISYDTFYEELEILRASWDVIQTGEIGASIDLF